MVRGWYSDKYRHSFAAMGTNTRRSIPLKLDVFKYYIVLHPATPDTANSNLKKHMIESKDFTILPSMGLHLGLLLSDDNDINSEILAYILLVLERYRNKKSRVISKDIKNIEYLIQQYGFMPSGEEIAFANVLSIIREEYELYKLAEYLDIPNKVKQELLKQIETSIFDTELTKYVLKGERHLYELCDSIIRKDPSMADKILPYIPTIYEWKDLMKFFKEDALKYYISYYLYSESSLEYQKDMHPLYLTLLNIDKFKDIYDLSDDEILSITKSFLTTLYKATKSYMHNININPDIMLAPLLFIGYGSNLDITDMTKDFKFLETKEKQLATLYARSIIHPRYTNGQFSFIDLLLLITNDKIRKSERWLMEWLVFTEGDRIISPSMVNSSGGREMEYISAYLHAIKDLSELTNTSKQSFKAALVQILTHRDTLYEIYQNLVEGNTQRAAEILHDLLSKPEISDLMKLKAIPHLELLLKETAIYKKRHLSDNSIDPIIIYSKLHDKFTPQEKLLITANRVLENEALGKYDTIEYSKSDIEF